MSLIERYRDVGPGRQILLVGLGGLVLSIALAGAYYVFLRKPYAPLFADLRAADAATIVAELEKKKTPYRLEDGGATILVPKALVDSTRLNVASEDLPIKGTVGFELFNKSDMGLTEFAQRINYQRALQGELARTMMTMQGIDAARVHLALAEASVFRSDRRPSKASVTLTPRPGASLSAATVAGVQRLVAAAVPELAAQDVVVLSDRGEVVSSEPEAPRVSYVYDSPPQGLEEDHAARLTSALRAVYQGRVQVTVSARGAGGGETTSEGGQGGMQLDVVIVLLAPPSSDLERQIRETAIHTLGLDPNRGDKITVATNAAAWTGPDEPKAAATERPAAAIEPAKSPLAYWLTRLVPVLLGLLALAVVLYSRRPVRARLSAPQREAFAAQLRGLMDEEGDRGEVR